MSGEPFPVAREVERASLARRFLNSEVSIGQLRLLCDAIAARFGVDGVQIRLVDDVSDFGLVGTGANYPTTPANQSPAANVIATGAAWIGPFGAGREGVFAGFPIIADPELTIGALALLARTPRNFSEAELGDLAEYAALAAQVVGIPTLKQRHVDNVMKNTLQANEIKQNLQRLALANKLARVGWWDYTIGSDRVDWSPDAAAIYETDLTSRIPIERFFGFYEQRFWPTIHEYHRGAVEDRQPFHFELPVVSGRGNALWLSVLGEPIIEGGKTVRIAGAVQDVTAHVRHGLVDAMTGVGNRRMFNDRLREDIDLCARQGWKLMLMELDLDMLKEVNDFFGHDAGDKLICEVARRLVEVTKGQATVCRLGGDEFAVVMPLPASGARPVEIVERIAGAMAPHWHFPDGTRSIPVSMGAAIYPQDGNNGEELQKSADLALYRCKEDAQRPHAFYVDDMRETEQRRKAEIEYARLALAKQRFRLYFQPIVGVQSGLLRGFEALLRIDHPELGLLRPARFAAAFEHPEISSQISNFVLDEAIRLMREWRARGIDYGRVAVNFTSMQLANVKLPAELSEKLASAGLTSADLEIEVVENVTLSEAGGRVGRVLSELRARGFAIALDDFGTGFASLKQLVELQTDTIKIDRSFIATIVDSEATANVVRAMVSMAHNTDRQIVAEGIETYQQLDMVVALGIDFAQGYLISRPIRAEDVPHYCGVETDVVDVAVAC